jgi:hypothetical protein
MQTTRGLTWFCFAPSMKQFSKKMFFWETSAKADYKTSVPIVVFVRFLGT